MMETIQVDRSTTMPVPQGWPANDNRQLLSTRRTIFPGDAIARIYRPSRSAMTSGRARTGKWRLVFEPRHAPFIEPLMGHTGSDDTLVQVELEFPTLEAAMGYAERQGLAYVVQTPPGQIRRDRPQDPGRTAAWNNGSAQAFSDATLDRLGLGELQESYGRALDGAARRNDPRGSDGWAAPMDVVRDPAPTLEAKRSILMNWAWTEYLIDQAANDGTSARARASRLHEVEQALLALERGGQAQRNQSGPHMAA